MKRKNIGKKELRSKFKFFGGFGLLIFLNICLGLFTYSLIVDLIKNYNSVDVILYTVFFALQIITLTLFFTQNKVILIAESSITFVNPILPFLRKTYEWKDFDYFDTIQEFSHDRTYEAVWLVKGNKCKRRFSSFYYTNYNALKSKIRLKKGKTRLSGPLHQFLILSGLKRL